MNQGPFRYDQVGSLLRTKELKEAKELLCSGAIAQKEYKETERDEIRKIVEKQKEIGLKAITDGEFNREYWHYDFISYLGGIQTYLAETHGKFHGAMDKLKSYYVKDRLYFPDSHPFIDDFKYLNGLCGKEAIAKATIPGPNMIYYSGVLKNPLFSENTAYEDRELLKADIAKVYQDAIKAYYDAGCRYLQFDDTSWGALFSGDARSLLEEKGLDAAVLSREFAEITIDCIKYKPEDMVLTTHCCRGNFKSSWLYDGDYSFVGDQLFRAPFDGYFLEFDSDRAGSFEPIKYLKQGKLVLGLLTSKTGEPESKEEIINRIREACEYLPLENLCLSCQCGFSSTEDGNYISEEQQYEKLRLVREIAEEVWADA